MRRLWRRTFELFRWYPILWIPYILAELLTTLLWRVRGAASEQIFDWFTTRRTVSVFGDLHTPTLNYRDQIRAAAAYAPLGFLTVLLCIGVFIFAMVLTASLVDMILTDQEPVLVAAVRASMVRWRGVLLLSLKFLVVYILCAMVIFVPMVSILWNQDPPPTLSQPPVSVYVGVLLLSAIAAWLLAPSALRLLQSSNKGRVDANVRKQVVIVVVAAVALMAVLGLIFTKLTAGIVLETPAELTIVGFATKLLVNSAYSPLFIALSLLAFRELEEAQPQQYNLA